MDRVRTGFVLLLWVLAPSVLTGQQVLTLDPGIGRSDLGGYLYIPEDSAVTRSFDQIASLPLDAFTPHHENKPNMGFSHSVFRVRFYVSSSAAETLPERALFS